MLFSPVSVNSQISFCSKLLCHASCLLHAMNCTPLDVTLENLFDKVFYLPNSAVVIFILCFSKNKFYVLTNIWWQNYEWTSQYMLRTTGSQPLADKKSLVYFLFHSLLWLIVKILLTIPLRKICLPGLGGLGFIFLLGKTSILKRSKVSFYP